MNPRALAVFAALAAASAFAQEAGKGIYRIYCAGCHGIRAEGGRGPDLTRARGTDADLHKIIANGSADGAMPAFAGQLSGDDTIRGVVAYLRAVAQPAEPPPVGDVRTGEKLFWDKHACGGCHRIGARGGRIGPDLTNTGRARSLRHLRESITDPDADIAPGQATVVVTLNDGREVRGVERGFTNFSAQLMDAGENYHSYLREDVRTLDRVKKSLMPAYRLSNADLGHLIVYLRSTGGQP